MKKTILTLALAAATSISAFAYTGVSDWAKPELEKAEAYSLIPAVLADADVSASINRSEFAALSVKLYEALSGAEIVAAIENPFTDTDDAEILKAYAAGITTGTSETTFDPEALLSREQAATMLARTYAYSVEGAEVTTADATAFADDADISDWAKESVYFMSENGIINGVGDNKFAPKANSSREQSVAISVRMFEKFGSEENAEVKEDVAETPTEGIEEVEEIKDEVIEETKEENLLKHLPVYNFGTLIEEKNDSIGSAVTLKDVKLEEYEKYAAEVARAFPTKLYSLDGDGYSYMMKNSNGKYIVTVAYTTDGNMSISIEADPLAE